MPSCGPGRCATSMASGRRSGTGSTSTAPTTACSAPARCPAPTGFLAPRSRTQPICSEARPTARWRSVTPRSTGRWPSGRGASSERARERWPARCARAASGAAIESPPTCPTSPRRSPRSWAARRSAPCGRPARRTSGSRASSTASRRSSRRCCSAWTAIATRARSSPSGPATTSCGARCPPWDAC